MEMKDRTAKSGCLLCGAKRSKMVHKFADLPKSRRGKQKLDIKCEDLGEPESYDPKNLFSFEPKQMRSFVSDGF